jgi:hypothetical protein
MIVDVAEDERDIHVYSLMVEIPEEGENADIDVETVIDIYYNKPDELEQLRAGTALRKDGLWHEQAME